MQKLKKSWKNYLSRSLTAVQCHSRAQDRSREQPHYTRPQLAGPGDQGHHPWRGHVNFNDSVSGSFDDAIELCFSLREKRTTFINVFRCSSVTLLLSSIGTECSGEPNYYPWNPLFCHFS